MSKEIEEYIIREPDDLHLHLRDGNSLKLLVPHAYKQYRRVIAMPNLIPPITTAKDALKYYNRIMSYVPKSIPFTPLMTLYLTDNTTPQMIKDAYKTGKIFAVKLYPKGATTNSENGVTNINKLQKTLQTMSELGILLLIHGEVTDKSTDIFSRESIFLKKILPNIIKLCPKLKIVLEHITTKEAVNFILNNKSNNIAATITAHHMISNRNDIFNNGISPHYYCLPIIKTEQDRQALVNAAISGNKKFFAGTDAAPHEKKTKECCNGKAGIYTGYSSVSLYTQIFWENNAMDKLQGFMSENGADFYGLERNKGKIKLIKKKLKIPNSFEYLDGELVPYKAGCELEWSCMRLLDSKL